jgi:hypothetical protein
MRFSLNMWFTSSFVGNFFYLHWTYGLDFMIENRNLDEVRAGRASGFTLEVNILNSAGLSFGAACAEI